jgi:hypothetical protein
MDMWICIGSRAVHKTFCLLGGQIGNPPDLLPWNVLDLTLVCSLTKETDDEAIEVFGRTDYRDPEGASGWAFGG